MSKALAPVDELRKSIKQMESQFKLALPQHVPVERFTRVIMTAIQNSPELVNATRQSLFNSCMRAAQDGLLPDGRESAIVTFKSKAGLTATFMPMVGGILKKIRNSGELSTITAQIVYKEDYFSYWIDSDGEHLEHRPNMFTDRGKRIGAYAIAKTKDGGIYIEVMDEKQIQSVRNVSRSKDSGPWSGPFEDEMIRKTVIRRLSKRLPMSTDIEDIIRRDDELFMPPSPDPKDVTPKTPEDATESKDSVVSDAKVVKNTKKKNKLHDAINVKSESVQEPPPPEEEYERPAAMQMQEEENELDQALDGEEEV